MRRVVMRPKERDKPVGRNRGRNVPLNCRYPPTKLRDVTTEKTTVLAVIAVETSELTT
jgi:hypothetical protein